MQAPLFRLPFPCIFRSALFGEYRPTWASDASTVGQNEHPVPNMRGTNGGSRYAMPFRIVPDLGQRPENSIQPPSKQRCHVLQHNRPGLQFSNQANGFKEQSASPSFKSCPSSGVGNILTREAADDAIDSFKVANAALSDVSLPADFRPMLFKDLRGIIINLHLPPANKASAFKPKIKPTNAGK